MKHDGVMERNVSTSPTPEVVSVRRSNMQVDLVTTFVFKIGLPASASGLWHFGIIAVSKTPREIFEICIVSVDSRDRRSHRRLAGFPRSFEKGDMFDKGLWVVENQACGIAPKSFHEHILVSMGHLRE